MNPEKGRSLGVKVNPERQTSTLTLKPKPHKRWDEGMRLGRIRDAYMGVSEN